MQQLSVSRFRFLSLVSVMVCQLAWTSSSPAEQTASPLVRVAIYSHSKKAGKGPKNLMRFLTPANGFQSESVSPEQIRNGVLKDYDVLIMPGGSGSLQSKKLEAAGLKAVREFTKKGGGYVGICAGSYLASSHYPWSLGLINAKVWDRSHWARGQGTVRICLSPAGSEVLGGDQKEYDVYYGQGPLLVPDNQPDLPGYEVLAKYGTEVALKGAPVGAMKDTHAIIRSKYGAGRVICFSPHPESANGPNSLIASGIFWAAAPE
ncbi:BPL-N domain-containing protein [Gimesia fumaroli]|uniref:Biotin-protein ligase N-terminal domain-containing protein n=1 Tax=Gimesia fumaroli TaxID=2527976 RepID=A0A518I9Q7_9PLAN|nr:BPL-N domain-containing protein [Gimesia fumaroli]QDV49837.1 hypothetical protein Enr17x_18580 [Gimesia fumaroli]